MKKLVFMFLFGATAFAVPTALQLWQDQYEVLTTRQANHAANAQQQADQDAASIAKWVAASPSPSPSPSPSASE